MTLQILGHSFAYEMECILRLFYPGEKITVTENEITDENDVIATRLVREEDRLSLFVSVQLGEFSRSAQDVYLPPEEDWEWDAERRMGVLLFELLCEQTDTRPPWGILTGVRPVRLCRKLLAKLGGRQAVLESLERDFFVLPQKAELAMATLDTQKEILAADTPDSYSLYVSIPFCPTRCLYCSFVSHAIDKAAKLVPTYLELLCRELEVIAETAAKLCLKLRTVYIGGGTPTTLNPEQLEVLLGQIKKTFPFSHLLEYTVEAGRPDSVTKEKLNVLKAFNVGRISINPQTMDDDTLKAIGRAHTAEETRQAMALARSLGFDNINMDLIAGLPGQTPESFADTLEQVLNLEAQNITIHTLTVKRSSTLRTRPDAFEKDPHSLGELLELSQKRLSQKGHKPYYLYRQQGTRQNLENTGFTLPGKEGLYNIFSMEDAHTILAAGAGGVTKLCGPGERMRRVFNFKYPYEYIDRFDQILDRKKTIETFYGDTK